LGEKATETRKIQQVASDFEVSVRVARVFWDVMRNGILHQGMPKQYEQGKKHPDWIFHHDPSDFAFELYEFNGKLLLIVQPWLVIDKVVHLWQENLDLFEQNESFPWAQVSSVTGSSSQSDLFLITGSSSGLSTVLSPILFNHHIWRLRKENWLNMGIVFHENHQKLRIYQKRRN